MGIKSAFSALSKALNDRESLSFIKKLLPSNDKEAREICSFINPNRRVDVTLLHTACRREVPVEVITFLIQMCPPSCAQQVNLRGCTPLHYAFQRQKRVWNSDEHVRVIRLLLDAYPTSAKYYYTTLHLACNSDCPPFPVIKTLMQASPCGDVASVLRWLRSSLRYESPSRAVMDYMANCCPAACLIEVDGMIPLDYSDVKPRIAQVTRAAAKGLIEAAVMPNSTMPESMIQHVCDSVPAATTARNNAGERPWLLSKKNPSLSRRKMIALIKNPDVQNTLRDAAEKYHAWLKWVNGFARMNLSRRRSYYFEDKNANDLERGFRAVASVRDDPECLFVCLLENHSLFDAVTPTPKKKQQQTSTKDGEKTTKKRRSSMTKTPAQNYPRTKGGK